MPTYNMKLTRPNAPHPETGEPQDDETVEFQGTGSTPEKALARVVGSGILAGVEVDTYDFTYVELDEDGEPVQPE